MKFDNYQEEMLRFIGNESDRLGLASYLVGGAVRDLILGRSCNDLDIIVEGNAYILVDSLFQLWSNPDGKVVAGKPIKYKKYGTAKLPLHVIGKNDLSSLDFASARRETYPQSGAQPLIEFSNITDDLARRDFSINALAVSLSINNFGQIVDNFCGLQHLEQKLVVILHAKSFEDDPARLIRAIRYIVRLGFRLDDCTKDCFNAAVSKLYLTRLPRFRLFDEFRKLLSEDLWHDMIAMMVDCGLLQQLSSSFRNLDVKNLKGENADWVSRLRSLYQMVDYTEGCKDLLSFGLSTAKISQILNRE